MSIQTVYRQGLPVLVIDEGGHRVTVASQRPKHHLVTADGKRVGRFKDNAEALRAAADAIEKLVGPDSRVLPTLRALVPDVPEITTAIQRLIRRGRRRRN